MKILNNRLFSFLIALMAVVFLFTSVNVSAVETDPSELVPLFEALSSSDGEETTSIVSALYAHFLEDPTTFVRLLSDQPQEIQDSVAEYVIYEAVEFYYPRTEFVDAVFSIRLNGDDNANAHAILTQLESAVEEIWGLRNPKTGDPVDGILAVMLSSGLAWGAILLCKRKYC